MSLCLITGGAGNIAVQLLPWLSKAGHEVVLWDVVSKPAAVQDKQVRFIQGDLTDPDHVPVSYTHLTLPTTPYV